MPRASRGARSQQVGRAGEYFVVAELNKRGAFAVPFAGNMPKIDLMACDLEQRRTVHIQVKAKRHKGSWQSSIVGSEPRSAPADPLDETNFWVFVSLGEVGESPRFWIVPDWWIRNDIYQAHQAYLERHGGVRPGNPGSKHHSIAENRLEEWEGRWEILGILE